MENLALKVIYQGKIIIIGKGIRTQESIKNHLQKRFNIPEEQIKTFSLNYEDGAKNLNQAYEKALQKGKQSVRIKIQQLRPQQISSKEIQQSSQNSKIDKLYHDRFQGLDKQGIFSERKQNQKEKDKKQQPHVLFIQEKQRKLLQLKKERDIDQFNTLNNEETSNYEAQDQNDSQQKLDQNSYIPLVAQISSEKIVTQQNQESSENMNSKKITSKQQENQSQKSSSQLLQYPKIQQKQQTYPPLQAQENQFVPLERENQTEKTQENQDQLFSSIPLNEQNNEKQDFNYYLKSVLPKQVSNLVTQAIEKIKSQLQNEFDSKITEIAHNNLLLQKKNQLLQSKYDDLFQKYQSLSLIVDQILRKSHNSQKEQKITTKPQLQGYKKIPNFEPTQFSKNNKVDEFTPEVQIQDIEARSQLQYRQSIKPQYFLVNTGTSTWPKNVYVLSESNDKFPIQSLKPNEEYIFEGKQIFLTRLGERVTENYRLIYQNNKGENVPFGRRFGINIVGVDRSYLNQKKKNEFIAYIRQLMAQKRIMNKNLKIVIDILRNMSINETNFKQIDKVQLANVIKFM